MALEYRLQMIYLYASVTAAIVLTTLWCVYRLLFLADTYSEVLFNTACLLLCGASFWCVYQTLVVIMG